MGDANVLVETGISELRNYNFGLIIIINSILLSLILVLYIMINTIIIVVFNCIIYCILLLKLNVNSDTDNFQQGQ